MIDILSLYHAIPDSDKRIFRAHCDVKQFNKNDFILIDGDVQTNLYMVKTGVAMMYGDQSDKMEVIDFAYANRFCVDIDSFSTQSSSNYCIKCLEACEVEWISYDDLEACFDASQDIERAYRRLMETVFAATIRRLLDQFSLTIEQRFERVVAQRPELFSLVPNKYIAAYLNIDPTNFSKLYKIYEEKPIRFW